MRRRDVRYLQSTLCSVLIQSPSISSHLISISFHLISSHLISFHSGVSDPAFASLMRIDIAGTPTFFDFIIRPIFHAAGGGVKELLIELQPSGLSALYCNARERPVASSSSVSQNEIQNLNQPQPPLCPANYCTRPGQLLQNTSHSHSNEELNSNSSGNSPYMHNRNAGGLASALLELKNRLERQNPSKYLGCNRAAQLSTPYLLPYAGGNYNNSSGSGCGNNNHHYSAQLLSSSSTSPLSLSSPPSVLSGSPSSTSTTSPFVVASGLSSAPTNKRKAADAEVNLSHALGVKKFMDTDMEKQLSIIQQHFPTHKSDNNGNDDGSVLKVLFAGEDERERDVVSKLLTAHSVSYAIVSSARMALPVALINHFDAILIDYWFKEATGE